MRVGLAVKAVASENVINDMAEYENNYTESIQMYLKISSDFWNVVNDTVPLSNSNDVRLCQLNNVSRFFNEWNVQLDTKYHDAVKRAKHFIPKETFSDLKLTCMFYKDFINFIRTNDNFKERFGHNLYIIPRRNTQDSLESFFAVQRQACGGAQNMTAFVYGYNIESSLCREQSKLVSYKKTNVLEVELCETAYKNNECLPKRRFKGTTIHNISWPLEAIDDSYVGNLSQRGSIAKENNVGNEPLLNMLSVTINELISEIGIGEEIADILQQRLFQNVLCREINKLYNTFNKGRNQEQKFNVCLQGFNNNSILFDNYQNQITEEIVYVVKHLVVRLWFQKNTSTKVTYPLKLNEDTQLNPLTEDENYYILDNGGWCFKRSLEEIKFAGDIELFTGHESIPVEKEMLLDLLHSLCNTVKLSSGKHRVFLKNNMLEFFTVLHRLVEQFTLNEDQSDVRIKEKDFCKQIIKFLSVNKQLREAWYSSISATPNLLFPSACKILALKYVSEFFVKVKQKILMKRYDLLPTQSCRSLRASLKSESTKRKMVNDKIVELQQNIVHPDKVKACLYSLKNENDLTTILLQMKGDELRSILAAIGLPSHYGKKKDAQVKELVKYLTENVEIVFKYPEKLGKSNIELEKGEQYP